MNDIFDRALKLIPIVRQDIIRQIPFELQGFIGAEMKLSKQGDTSKNTTSILNVRTGNLFRSFTKNNQFNILKQTNTGVEYGSKVVYAAIHEYGGIIKHPGSTKIQSWLNGGNRIVTRGTKPHDIPMPQRPYLAPAIKKFQEQALEALVYRCLEPLRQLFV